MYQVVSTVIRHSGYAMGLITQSDVAVRPPINVAKNSKVGNTRMPPNAAATITHPSTALLNCLRSVPKLC